MRSDRKFAAVALGLAICAVPLSIAVTEILLAVALLLRFVAHGTHLGVPRIFRLWLILAALASASWLLSPDRAAGLGEMRHLLLIAAMFVVLPVIQRPRQAVAIWRWLFVSATIGSASLIIAFLFRLIRYRHELSTVSDPSFYLRTGGLLHHWMVFGTVEILVLAGMLQFWTFYPEQHRRLIPLFSINALAIYLSLTRTLWVSSLVVLGIHLIWRRSKWIWALPVLPAVLFLIAPGGVRSRVTESLSPSYYSNAERLQMLEAGWKMILDHPLAGVGPGRVDKVYRDYLSPGDPVPAFHGHLHNNIVQIAAEFGLPVAAAAAFFVMALALDLRRRAGTDACRDHRFLCDTALLGLAGYLTAGLFEYTYGHSLGLILLSFVALAPLVTPEQPVRVMELAGVANAQ